MTPEMVMNLASQGMKVTLFLAGPLLLTALSIGLLVSLFQPATQTNEMTLTFTPKILGVCVVLLLVGPFLLALIVDFTRELITNIPVMLN